MRKNLKFIGVATVLIVLTACGRATLSADDIEEINLSVRTESEKKDSWIKEVNFKMEGIQVLYENGQNMIVRQEELFGELSDRYRSANGEEAELLREAISGDTRKTSFCSFYCE